MPYVRVSNESLAETFQRLRKHRGITQYRAGALLGVNRSYVWELESGKSPCLSSKLTFDQLGRLAEHADVDVLIEFKPRQDEQAKVMIHRFDSFSELSEREISVLQWVAHGKKGEEIAEILGTSLSAVRGAINRLLNKLGAATSSGAVAIGLRKGIIK